MDETMVTESIETSPSPAPLILGVTSIPHQSYLRATHCYNESTVLTLTLCAVELLRYKQSECVDVLSLWRSRLSAIE